MFRKTMIWAVMAITITGQGLVPSGALNVTHGEMLARRAAIVDIYRQNGGSQGLSIVNESFDGHVYRITAAVEPR